MIVLDTDVLSRLRRGNDERLNRWLASLPEPPRIASYSVAEIEYGIELARRRDPRLASRLSVWLDMIVATTDVLPLDAPAARLVGGMRAITGLRPLEGDLLIAATVVVNDATLATFNRRDYQRIKRHFPALVLAELPNPT